MIERKFVDEEFCWDIIKSNHQTYFKAKSLAEEIIAKRYETTVKYVVDCLKRLDDPFEDDRKQLKCRLIHILKRLNERGLIEKYNSKFWRIKK